MLDQLFKRKPHARSESSPHLRDSLANSFFPSGSTLLDDVFTDDVPIAPTNRGQPRQKGQLQHSFDATILTEPVQALQSDLCLPRHVARDLPPLLMSPIELSSPTKSPCSGINSGIHDFAHSPTRSPQSSPTRLKRLSTPLFTGDHTGVLVKEPTPNKIASWFNGQSEPINIGILPSPTKERLNPLAVMSPTKPLQSTPKPAITSRFSFFSTKPSPTKPSLADDPNDEFFNLDISTALFPAGPADPFSPSSFKNLVQNAEGLLTRLQAAYKERTLSFREMTTEKDTIAEELEGAETRSKHLKIQLDDMSAKLTEQDNAMMELVDDLANVKRLRREEEEARKRTIRAVKPSISKPVVPHGGQNPTAERPLEHRRQRRERLSSTSTTDCDSGDESSAESLFSKVNCTSSRMSLSSVSTMSSPEIYHQPDLSLTSLSSPHPQAAPRQAPRTPDKLNGSSPYEESVVWSCRNCQGQGASEAWGVVEMLKEENKCLKERVQHVEGALEGCLDVVAQLG